MKYTINISKILQADVDIEANSECEAIQKAKDMYAACEIILTADEFASVSFKVKDGDSDVG